MYLAGLLTGGYFTRIGKLGLVSKINGKVNVSFGKNINLKSFADKNGTISMHSFDDAISGFIDAKPNFNNFEDAFNFVTESVLNTNGSIKFNLEFVNIQKAMKIKPGTGLYQKLDEFGGKSLWEMEMTTEWELNKILNNSDLLKATEFYKMDKKIPTESVTNKKKG